MSTTMRWRGLPVPLDVGTHAVMPKNVIVATENAALPCRKCLTDGKPGEKMLLLSYDPFIADSPYRQHGPIFIHAEPECFAPRADADKPKNRRINERLSIRGFGKNHMLAEHDVIDGENLVEKAEEWFAQGNVEYLHVHYAGPGCFAVRVDKV